ncbi:MAG: protein of unknown function transrane [Polaromonas sp.]|nr:protein of unknown function transrane [Polaromonas sp.]
MGSLSVFTNRKVVCDRYAVLPAVGRRLSGMKNGYALFAIAPHDIPPKLVFAGYRFILAGLV